MLEWIAKYWLEALFGVIVSGLTFMVKRYIKMTRESQEGAQKEHDKALLQTIDTKFEEQNTNINTSLRNFDQRLEDQKTDMQAQMGACYNNLLSVVDKRDDDLLTADKNIRADIQSLKSEFGSVKNGMLTVQGRTFKDDCHRLLDPAHTISLVEFENVLMEHRTYNELGGNHEGDVLFRMVEAKFKKDLDD